MERAAGPFQHGIYHTGGAPEVAWKFDAMTKEPDEVFIQERIWELPNALEQWKEPDDGAQCWERSSQTCGLEEHGINQRHVQTRRIPSWSVTAFSKGLGVWFSPWVFRIALSEFDEDMQNHESTEAGGLEYWT